MSIKHITLAITAALISPSLFAASFDCLKAATPVETLICDRADISELDVKLATIYASAQKADSSVRGTQRIWLKQRNECTDDICILTAYKQRIYDLEEVLAGMPAVAPANGPQEPQALQASIPAVAPPAASAPAEQSGNPIAPPAPITAPTPRSEPSQDNTGQTDGPQKEWWEEHFVALTISAIVGLGIPLIGFSQRCPKCKRWFAAKLLRRKLLDERTDFRTVTRRDQHKDTKGNLIKTVERKEQIQVQISTYRNSLLSG